MRHLDLRAGDMSCQVVESMDDSARRAAETEMPGTPPIVKSVRLGEAVRWPCLR